MRMLYPTPRDDVDPLTVYADVDRRAPEDRPYVLVGMIATVDGAATDDQQRSTGLGGDGDRRVFAAIRAVADVIVAGASTVRAEDYGPPRPTASVRAARLARGQAERPRIAVVSASLDLDPGMRLFAEAEGPRPLIVTGGAGDPAARRRLEPVADVVVAGESRGVEWPRALAALRAGTGATVVVAEGGPSVNGQLVSADLVDEICLTVAPVLAGSAASRIAHGAPSPSRGMALAHVLEDAGFLMLRYVRARRRRPA